MLKTSKIFVRAGVITEGTRKGPNCGGAPEDEAEESPCLPAAEPWWVMGHFLCWWRRSF